MIGTTAVQCLSERGDSTTKFLQEIPLLAGLPRELLTDVASHTRRLRVPAGQVVMHEGTTGDGLYLLVEGELEVTRRCGEQEVVLAVFGSGAFLGEMSLVEHTPRTASVRTLRDSELLVIEPEDFERLLERSPATALTLLRTVLARLRSTEASLIQHGKLASLGTLAAGLAHELNNPAAALRSGLPHLRDALAELERAAARLGSLGLLSIAEARLEVPGGAADRPVAAPFGPDAIEAEDRLLDWLEAHGVEHSVRMASPLLLAGWTPAALTEFLEGLDARHVTPVLDWLAVRCAASALIDEMSLSAGAISDIVAAVKAHSALGQPLIREQDVVQGIESALLILGRRLRDGITVLRNFDPMLPRVEAFGAELNHVWANLIENAIDAMRGRGTLELRAAGIGNALIVEVTDSGPGIPSKLRERVFDPFFTTKPIGSGTGLGLHVAYNIVRRHGGTITVESRPGRTTFSVVLPLRIRSPD
jgi:signal transduction histidine kinase